MLVVACDGIGCPEACSLVDTEDYLDQLRRAGWSIAVDGADLCAECTAVERRKQPFPRALTLNR